MNDCGIVPVFKKLSVGKTGMKLREGKYPLLLHSGHPRACSSGYVPEHVLVCEKAIGKPLPPAAVVHHVNEIPSDNRNANLVICEDQAYHKLLHRRLRIVQAGGNPNTDKVCWCCKLPKPREGNFHKDKTSPDGYHRQCIVCAKPGVKARNSKRYKHAG